MAYNEIVAAWKLQSVSPTAWDSLPIEEKVIFALMYGQSIVSNTLRDKLTSYGSEFNNKDLTLDQLIDAHRSLREHRLKTDAITKAEIEKERQRGEENGRQFALENNWFSRERLREIRVGELVNLLADEKDD